MVSRDLSELLGEVLLDGQDWWRTQLLIQVTGLPSQSNLFGQNLLAMPCLESCESSAAFCGLVVPTGRVC